MLKTSNPRKTEHRTPPPPLIYRERDMMAVTSLSRKAREDAIKAGTFPKPIPLSEKCRGWVVSEVEAWVARRAALRDEA